MAYDERDWQADTEDVNDQLGKDGFAENSRLALRSAGR
jgi:hypothetical protein